MTTTPHDAAHPDAASAVDGDTRTDPRSLGRGVATVRVGDDRELQVVAEPPARIGRYVVVEQVGSGGMGRVLRAYDPRLRREVALKLLTPRWHDPDGAARMVREAQAMARLSHPNIVPIYDVERDDTGAQVFIAMEYVEGDTLREWLVETSPPWREVVRAFIAAGHGLAAAHAAGVIHRDFKPQNVMVGTDGRVRVMDFGLARSATGEHSDSHLGIAFDDIESELTQAGMALGTPAYMAPEQHSDGDVGPSSDQYAFCVALYEALHGVQPFVARDLDALVRAKLAGVGDSPPANARALPRWLRTAVTRGLAVDPAARWESMQTLLAVLERGLARARLRPVLFGVGALALLGSTIALAVVLGGRERVAACERAGAEIDTIWNDVARTRLHDALVATGVSYAEITAANVTPWLDQHARAWQQARTDACLDTNVREIWDADTLDRSLWCLDERRMAFDAIVVELGRADADVVQKAVTAVAGLASVAPCRDPIALGRLPPPPTDRREEIREARADLTRVNALARAGKYSEADELAQSSGERAEALGWPPLVAEGLMQRATLLQRLGPAADSEAMALRAYFIAVEVGAWDIAAEAAGHLTFVIGDLQRRYAEGLVWARHAEVTWAHVGTTDPLRESKRLTQLASVHLRHGDLAEARAYNEQALALIEGVLGPDHPTVAMNLGNLANTEFADGRYVRAKALLERVLKLFEDACGPEHPDVGQALNNLAAALYALGDHAGAVAAFERSIVVFEQTVGKDHMLVASSLINLGAVLGDLDDLPGARAAFERALAMQERLGSPEIQIAPALNNLATIEIQAGDYPRAQELLERAIVMRERGLGPDHPEVAKTIDNLATTKAALGEHDAARALDGRALAIAEKAYGPGHHFVGHVLLNAAKIEIAAGDIVAATAMLERAVALYDVLDAGHPNQPIAHFALAKVLVTGNGDRERARSLAVRARDGWRAAGATAATEAAEADTWLAALDAAK